MKKEFILYEQALALQELGFDEPCLSAFFEDKIKRCDNIKNSTSDYLSAPLYQQAFRWFREKYGFHGSINQSHGVVGMYNWDIIDKHLNCIGQSPYYSFEEAELECLKKLIKIVKNDKI